MKPFKEKILTVLIIILFPNLVAYAALGPMVGGIFMILTSLVIIPALYAAIKSIIKKEPEHFLKNMLQGFAVVLAFWIIIYLFFVVIGAI